MEYKWYDPASMDRNGQIAISLSEERTGSQTAYIHESRVFFPITLMHRFARTIDQTFGKIIISSLSTGLGTSLMGPGQLYHSRVLFLAPHFRRVVYSWS